MVPSSGVIGCGVEPVEKIPVRGRVHAAIEAQAADKRERYAPASVTASRTIRPLPCSTSTCGPYGKQMLNSTRTG